MNMPLVLLNRRRRGGAPAFSPATLFALADPGIWLDPSDLSTMFSDRAGTTPVTAPGTVVGLRLDKSKGLALGSEVVVNGSFATDTDWVKDAGWTIGGGVLSYDGTDAPNSVHQVSAILASGKSYRVSITVTMTQGALVVRPQFNSATGGYQITSSGTYSLLLSGLGGSLGLLAASFGSRFIGTVDNISVRELAGNHATAPTDAARPTYGVEPKGGRRNLLLNTDTLSTQSVTVTNVLHVLSFSGTGTVTLSGVSTAGPLVGTGAGNRVYLEFTPTAGSLTLTVSGSVTFAQLERG